MSREQADREAVDWLLRLESAGLADQVAFDAWLNAAPAHGEAWQRVNNLFAAPLAHLAAVEQRHPGQLPLARELLVTPMPRRRVLRGGLAVLLVGASGAAVLERFTTLEGLLADLHTATGEQARMTLTDGSRLMLTARSAADVQVLDGQPRVTLREGALYLAQAAGPVRLTCAEGELYCDQARLTLRRLPGASLLGVEAGRVRVVATSGQVTWVQAGQVLRFGAGGSGFEAPSLWSRSDWIEGRVEVRNEPLGELVAFMRPYHPGWMQVSAQAAQLRVYGSFVLNDLPRTLQALASSQPISLRQVGRWWTRIDVKSA